MERTASILGLRITDMNRSELLERLRDLSLHGSRAVVGYCNIHAANLAYTQPRFRDLVNATDVVFCDGYGVKLAAALAGLGSLHRHSVPDFINSFCESAAGEGRRVFFLGGADGVAEAASKAMTTKFEGLSIGSHHGYFDRQTDSPENQLVLNSINAFGTDVLLVGFGMPLQEAWIRANAAALDVRLIVAVGALFDYLSGALRRPPRWMTDHGLEWLGRIVLEPRRLWRRYILGIPLFYWRVLKHHAFGFPLPGDGS